MQLSKPLSYAGAGHQLYSARPARPGRERHNAPVGLPTPKSRPRCCSRTPKEASGCIQTCAPPSDGWQRFATAYHLTKCASSVPASHRHRSGPSKHRHDRAAGPAAGRPTTRGSTGTQPSRAWKSFWSLVVSASLKKPWRTACNPMRPLAHRLVKHSSSARASRRHALRLHQTSSWAVVVGIEEGTRNLLRDAARDSAVRHDHQSVSRGTRARWSAARRGRSRGRPMVWAQGSGGGPGPGGGSGARPASFQHRGCTRCDPRHAQYGARSMGTGSKHTRQAMAGATRNARSRQGAAASARRKGMQKPCRGACKAVPEPAGAVHQRERALHRMSSGRASCHPSCACGSAGAAQVNKTRRSDRDSCAAPRPISNRKIPGTS